MIFGAGGAMPAMAVAASRAIESTIDPLAACLVVAVWLMAVGIIVSIVARGARR